MIMKKHLLCTFVLLVLSTQGFSQFKIGAAYFPQLTSTAGFIPFKKEIVNSNNLPTFTSGAGVLFTYDSYYKPRGIQVGVLYSSHNQRFVYKYSIGDESFTDPNKKLFDYLKFNVLLRKFGYVHKFVKSTFYFGPQFSYLLRYKGGIVVYDENKYYDLPPTTPNIYYKTYSIDAVIGYSLEYAITRDIDLFTSLRLDYGITNIEKPGVVYNNVKVFSGTGAHQLSVALQIGAQYVFHRRDHILLPTNSWRYRVYKKKGIKGIF